MPKTDSEKLKKIKDLLDAWIDSEDITTETVIDLVEDIGEVFYPDA